MLWAHQVFESGRLLNQARSNLDFVYRLTNQ